MVFFNLESIRIPNLSPAFDPDWNTNGLLYKHMDHLVDFLNNHQVKGVTVHALKDKDRTPFLIIDVAASDPNIKSNVLLYGHMDKQPYGEGWKTNPTDPVIEDGLLFGRGSSDDCYAFYTSILAIKAC